MNFVVLAPARSGSTLLREILSRHPSIHCHGELFAQNKVRSNNPQYFRDTGRPALPVEARNSDLTGFLDHYTRYDGDKAVGFKLLLEHIDTAYRRFSGQMKEYPFSRVELARHLGERGFKIVTLWRDNLVSRLNSEVNLMAAKSEQIEQRIRQRFSEEQALADFQAQEESIQRGLEILVREGCQHVSHIHYEDLLANPDILNETFAALGLDGMTIKIPPKPKNTTTDGFSIKDKLSPQILKTYTAYRWAPSSLGHS